MMINQFDSGDYHEPNTEELGEYLHGLIIQDAILEDQLYTHEIEAVRQYRDMVEERIAPRVKDIDYENCESICCALEDSIGLSGVKIWRRIANELIHDNEVLETLQTMDKSPFRRWIDSVCDGYQSKRTDEFIEASKKLDLPTVVTCLENCYSNNGISSDYPLSQMSDLSNEHRDNLTEILERDAPSFVYATRDYERELNMKECDIEGAVMKELMNYLRKWKPYTKLSTLNQICRDEQLYEGVDAFIEAECYVMSR